MGSDRRDWSIDLETLDKTYSSAIVAIGAVQFDRMTGEIGIRHYVEIELDSAIKVGTVSGSTLSWWMRQDKAREVFGEGRKKVPLACALSDFAALLRADIAPRVWGNGSSFDITILERAYLRGAYGLAIPWDYHNVYDMRTIVAAAGLDFTTIPDVGTHHNALDDAVYQATAISAAWRTVRAALGDKLPSWKGLPLKKGDVPPPADNNLEDDDEL